MDDLVRQALARWPNVPDCYGWLALDARGQWRIGEQRQSITHAPTIAFINRNYGHDEHGAWLFQNGPQRVYVALDYTPFVWRLMPDERGALHLTSHAGARAVTPSGIWLDDGGRFLIEADGCIGVLHDHDSALMSERLCDGAGQPLDDGAIDRAIGALMQGQDVSDAGGAPYVRLDARLDAHLDTHTLLPVRAIGAAEVAERFGFIARPAPGLSA